MKQTSIEKLSEVYNALKDLDKTFLHDFGMPRLINLIQDVIRAESITKPKGSKFDIYNYTSNNPFRDQIQVVFHEGGVRVASDSHIMVAIKQDYPAEYEGRVILKDGSIVKTMDHETAWKDRNGEHSVYPDWRRVVPNFDKEDYKPYDVDAEKFYAAIAELRAQWKAWTGKSKKFVDLWYVKVGYALLKAEFFDKMLTAMKELGTTQVLVCDGHRPVVAKSDKGIVLLMPLMPGQKSGEHIIELA